MNTIMQVVSLDVLPHSRVSPLTEEDAHAILERRENNMNKYYSNNDMLLLKEREDEQQQRLLDQPFMSKEIKWNVLDVGLSSMSPCRRCCHTCTVVKQKLYVFGGQNQKGNLLNDLHYFDIPGRVWWGCHPAGIWPRKRMNHSAFVISTDNVKINNPKIVFHGGIDEKQIPIGDAYALNIVDYDKPSAHLASAHPKLTYEKFEQNGAVPSPRFAHTIVSYKQYAYLFGGQGCNFDNDLYSLRLDLALWTRIIPNAALKPTGRFNHELSAVNNSLILFGGRRHSILQDMWIFDLHKKFWNRVILHHGSAPPPVLSTPKGRVVNFCIVYMFGGEIDGDLVAHVFDVTRLSWAKSVVKYENSVQPINRIHHAVEVFNGNELFVFGGLAGRALCDLSVATLVDRINTENIWKSLRPELFFPTKKN